MMPYVVHNVRRQAFLRDRFSDGHNICYTWTPDERRAKRFAHGSYWSMWNMKPTEDQRKEVGWE